MDKADADTALSRLQRAERAHLRNQDALRHAIGEYEAEITRLAALAQAVDAAIGQRQDTRGDKFTMTVGDTRHDKRADAGAHLKDILEREVSGLTGQLRRPAHIGRLAGFTVTADVHRSPGAPQITITLDGAPGTTIALPASGVRGTDPVGLVTRLEHRIAQLETRKASALADIEHAGRQIAHARASIGQPFPHASELAAARDRAREIDQTLNRMAQQDASHDEAAGPAPGDTSSYHEPGTGRTGAQTEAVPQTCAGNDLDISAPARREPGRAATTAPRHHTTQPSPQRPATAAAPRQPTASTSATAHDPGPAPAADTGGPARWPSPDPHGQPPAWPGTGQAGRQTGANHRAAQHDSSDRKRTTPEAAPSADWRDDIISAARQPWNQPGPSWPDNPALHRSPGTPAREAGIEPDPI
jgi:hypothetical protein